VDRKLILSLAVTLLLAAPAHAQEDDAVQSEWDGAPIAAAEPYVATASPDRWSVLTTFGDETCPEAKPDEIVVCATLPESERYRVPASLRETDDTPVGGAAWGSRVEAYDDIARQSRPGSCSAVGTYGWTGCTAAALRQWFAERRSAQ
jgi:hypothetical protein